MIKFAPQHINHYSTTELEQFAAAGHNIPSDVYLRAQEREGVSNAQITIKKHINKLKATHEAERLAAREAQRPTLENALANHAAAKEAMREPYRALQEAKANHATARSNVMQAWANVRDVVGTHFTDKSDPSKSDPENYLRDSDRTLVINGQTYGP